jgi:HK97 family phage major capsid protein
MTELEIKDKRELLREENRSLLLKGKEETRKLNQEEESSFNANLEAIRKLDADLRSAEETRNAKEVEKVTPKMEVKMEKRFSLIQALRDEINHKPHDEVNSAIIAEGRSEFERSSIRAEGSIIIPAESRAVVVTGQTTGTTAGGYAIQTDKKTVLPPLTNYLVLTKAGATYLTGLVGNVSIPTYSGTTVAWKAEVTTAAEGAGTWGKVDMNPKKLCAYIDVSKLFLLQDSVGAEAMLMENISKAIAAKLEATILGVGEGGVATEPQGLFWDAYTSAATTFSWSALVGLESTVDGNNALANNMAYITNAKGRGMAKTTLVTTTYGDRMVMNPDGTINGYPVYVSNGVPKLTDFSTTTGTGFIFGNWADLIIGQWGGYDILVDPYTQAHLGEVRILVNCYFDAAVARTASFKSLHTA